MKKLFIVTLLGLSFSSFADMSIDIPEPFEGLTFTTISIINPTFSGTLIEWPKEKLEALSEDIAIYDLTGEVRPELAQVMMDEDGEIDGFEGHTQQEVVDIIRLSLNEVLH